MCSIMCYTFPGHDKHVVIALFLLHLYIFVASEVLLIRMFRHVISIYHDLCSLLSVVKFTIHPIKHS